MAQTIQAVSVDKSLERLAAGCKSPETVQIYKAEIKKFARFLQLSPEVAVRGSFDWSAVVCEYLALLESKNRRVKTRQLAVYAIEKWFQSNGVKLSEKLKAPAARGEQTKRVILSKLQLARIVSFADLQTRVMILVGLCTGLPAEKMGKLRVKDLPSLLLTPEARESVEAYLRLRRKRKESIDEDSFLLSRTALGYVPLNSKWKDALIRAEIDPLPFGALKEYRKAWSRVAGVELTPILTLFSSVEDLQPIVGQLESKVREAEASRDEWKHRYEEFKRLTKQKMV